MIIFIDQTGWKELTLNKIHDNFENEEIISFDHSGDMIEFLKQGSKKVNVLIQSIDEVTHYVDKKGSYLSEITEEVQEMVSYLFKSIKNIPMRILIGSSMRFNSRYKEAIDFLVYEKSIFHDWENEDSDSVVSFLKTIEGRSDLKLPRRKQENHKFFSEYKLI